MKHSFSTALVSLFLATSMMASDTPPEDLTPQPSTSPDMSHRTQGFFHEDTPEEIRHKFLKEAFGHKNSDTPEKAYKRFAKELPQIWIPGPKIGETSLMFAQRFYDILISFDYKKIVENVKLLLGDCSNTNFSGYNFSHANLSNTQLNNLDFSRCDFTHANLINTNFDSSVLIRADLRGALMRGLQNKPDLDTRLSNAKLSHANLQGVLLPRSLPYVSFYSADLTQAKAPSSAFGHCNMMRANLTSADLTGATLQQVSLDHANMTNTIITHITKTADVVFPVESQSANPAPSAPSAAPAPPAPASTGWHVTPRTAGIVTLTSFISGALASAWMLL